MEDVDELMSDYGDAEEHDEGDINSFKIRYDLRHASYTISDIATMGIETPSVSLTQRCIPWKNFTPLYITERLILTHHINEVNCSCKQTYLSHSMFLTDVVWPEKKQIALIDSIFRNYYVPPILFLLTTVDSGDVVRICMDGKQRLTSIQKFFDGQVRIPPHSTA